MLESSAWALPWPWEASPRKPPPQTEVILSVSASRTMTILSLLFNAYYATMCIQSSLRPECRAAHSHVLVPRLPLLSECSPWGGIPRASSRSVQDPEAAPSFLTENILHKTLASTMFCMDLLLGPSCHTESKLKPEPTISPPSPPGANIAEILHVSAALLFWC